VVINIKNNLRAMGENMINIQIMWIKSCLLIVYYALCEGREEQKFFPIIITRQNKFDELLVQVGVNNMTIKSSESLIDYKA
jgi:hypothetical protein